MCNPMKRAALSRMPWICFVSCTSMGMCEFGYASEPHGANSNLRRNTSEMGSSRLRSTRSRAPVWKSKFYGTFVLNRRVDLHAIDAMPAR